MNGDGGRQPHAAATPHERPALAAAEKKLDRIYAGIMLAIAATIAAAFMTPRLVAGMALELELEAAQIEALGEAVYANVMDHSDINLNTLDADQDLAAAALAAVGAKLAAAAGTDYDFTVELDNSEIRHRVVSYPHGAITFSYALFAELDDEEKTAAILAQQMAHVIRRDLARQLIARNPFDALYARATGRWDWMGDTINLTDAGFERAQEEAADCAARDLLAAAGYPPGAMAAALEHLQSIDERGLMKKASRRSLRWEMTRSHPAFGERAGRVLECEQEEN